jgi:hypothetical protein
MAGHNLKPVTQLFKESSKAVRSNLELFVLLSSVAILDLAWQIGTNLKDKTHGSPWRSIISDSLTGTHSGTFTAGSGFLFFIIFIAGVVLSLMAVILAVRAAQVKVVRFEDVWTDFKRLWLRLIGVEILSALLIVVSFLLLIVPGVFVMPRLVLAPYLLIDQNVGVREALNRSWDMTKGYLGAIWVVILFGLVLSLPKAVPIVGPIVAFVLILFYTVAMPLRYFEIKKAK